MFTLSSVNIWYKTMYADYYYTRLLHVITAVEFERSLGSVDKSVASGSVSVYRAGRTGLNHALRLFNQCSLSMFISYLVLYHSLLFCLLVFRTVHYGDGQNMVSTSCYLWKNNVIVVEVSLVTIHRVVSTFL